MRQKVWKYTWVCDGCEYVISSDYNVVEAEHIVLNLEGEEFHFHAKGHGFKDQDCLTYFQKGPLVKETLLAERKRITEEIPA